MKKKKAKKKKQSQVQINKCPTGGGRARTLILPVSIINSMAHGCRRRPCDIRKFIQAQMEFQERMVLRVEMETGQQLVLHKISAEEYCPSPSIQLMEIKFLLEAQVVAYGE